MSFAAIEPLNENPRITNHQRWIIGRAKKVGTIRSESAKLSVLYSKWVIGYRGWKKNEIIYQRKVLIRLNESVLIVVYFIIYTDHKKIIRKILFMVTTKKKVNFPQCTHFPSSLNVELCCVYAIYSPYWKTAE